MATHPSILAWRIPWTEEPRRLQSMWWERVRHEWASEHSIIQQDPENVRVRSKFWNSLVQGACCLLGKPRSREGHCLTDISKIIRLYPGPWMSLGQLSSCLLPLLLLFSLYIASDSLLPRGLQPAKLLSPRDFTRKNIVLGCHFFLQGIFPTPAASI